MIIEVEVDRTEAYKAYCPLGCGWLDDKDNILRLYGEAGEAEQAMRQHLEKHHQIKPDYIKVKWPERIGKSP